MRKGVIATLAVIAVALAIAFGWSRYGTPTGGPEPNPTGEVVAATSPTAAKDSDPVEPAQSVEQEPSDPTPQSANTAGDGQTTPADAASPGVTATTGASPSSDPAQDGTSIAALPQQRELPDTATQATEPLPGTGGDALIGEADTDASAPESEGPDAGVANDAPRFDVVRVDADGQTVIAGTAGPNKRVEVLLDGEVVGTATADAGGAFVTVIFADLADTAQQLQLRVPLDPPLPVAPATEASTPVASAQDAVTSDQTEPATPTQDFALSEPNAPQTPASGAIVHAPPSSVDDVAVLSETSTLGGQKTVAQALQTPTRTGEAPDEGNEDANAGASAETPQPQPDAETAPAAENAPTTEGSTAAPERQDPADAPSTGSSEPPQSEPNPATPQISSLATQDTGSDETSLNAIGSQNDDVAGSAAGQLSTLDTSSETALALSGPTQSARPALPGQSQDQSFALSAPVIILPTPGANAAPALVQPRSEELAVLQPGGEVNGVTLDRITYGEIGDVQLSGRGTSKRAVRIYGNAEILGTTRVSADGRWTFTLAHLRALDIKLFRFDELDAAGAVTSRIETPFQYSALSPQTLEEREIVVQRGDYLWRIAEQYYGEGLRYSLIYGANAELIRDPDLIYPGQVFTIPQLVDAN